MNEKLESAALTAYSQQFARKASAEFFANHTVVTGKQILDFTSIQQVNLLVLYYLFKQWQEETERLRSPYFDFEAIPVKEALQQFMNTLSQYISVQRENFEPLVAKATAATIKLFLTPYSFFDDLLRDLGPAITPDQLKEALRYIQINKSFFKAFIERVETNAAEKVYVNEALATLSNVFIQHQDILESPDLYVSQFSEVVPLSPESLRSTKAADQSESASPENFFASIVPADVSMTKTRPDITPQVDIEQFASAVNTAPIPPVTVAPPVTTPLPATTPPPFTTAPPVTTSPSYDSPLSGNTSPQPDVNKSLNEKFVREQVTLNDRLKTEPKPTLLDKHRRQRIDDIKSAITLNQKFLFINGLFKGDNAMFYQALNEIEQCADYHSAVSLLKDKYAARNGWDLESEEVNTFFEVIERKFY